jgi:hypothetical protein
MRAIFSAISVWVAIVLGGCQASHSSQAFQALVIRPDAPPPTGLIPRD